MDYEIEKMLMLCAGLKQTLFSTLDFVMLPDHFKAYGGMLDDIDKLMEMLVGVADVNSDRNNKSS
jgi:hypothetical protein